MKSQSKYIEYSTIFILKPKCFFFKKKKIYWIEPSEKPIELFHFLKLYPPEGQIVNPKKPVVSEFYEEIVFNQPRESFYETLMLHSSILPKPSKYSEYCKKYDFKQMTKFLMKNSIFKLLNSQKKKNLIK